MVDAKVAAIMVLPGPTAQACRAAGWQLKVKGEPVWHHTLRRLDAIQGVDELLIVYGSDVQLHALPEGLTHPVKMYQSASPLETDLNHALFAARKWAMTGWRGGLAGTLVYDEIFYASALSEAMEAKNIELALLCGADWLMVDPRLGEALLEAAHEHPGRFGFMFTQAPPGLAPCVINPKITGELGKQGSWPGRSISYLPQTPQPDPIGKDMCVLIESGLRNQQVRAIYDQPRWREAIDAALAQPEGLNMDVETFACVLAKAAVPEKRSLPYLVEIELSLDRKTSGPTVPQSQLEIAREPMPLAQVKAIIDELASTGDCCVMFGGLGDALLYPEIEQVLQYASEAGLFAVGIETDLHVSEEEAEALLQLPIDLIALRMNADSEEVYEEVMGSGQFIQVQDAMTAIYNAKRGTGKIQFRPWLVPQFVKMRENLCDMESFYDRSIHFFNNAVLKPFQTGHGLIEDHSTLKIAEHLKLGHGQLEPTMYIHCDGQVTFDEEDWLGKDAVGNVHEQGIAKLWQAYHAKEQL